MNRPTGMVVLFVVVVVLVVLLLVLLLFVVVSAWDGSRAIGTRLSKRRVTGSGRVPSRISRPGTGAVRGARRLRVQNMNEGLAVGCRARARTYGRCVAQWVAQWVARWAWKAEMCRAANGTTSTRPCPHKPNHAPHRGNPPVQRDMAWYDMVWNKEQKLFTGTEKNSIFS